jgi:RNA polymerase sporulation-specific sigma factor
MSAIEAKISLPRLGLLDEETTKRLIAMSQAGDTSARDKLVQHNMRLVYSVVSHLARPGCEFEDLFQVGCLGLMKAIDRFDLTYDVRFSTYAVPVIAGEVRRLIREDGMIKVSRSVRQLGRRLMAAREKLVADLSREPTIAELAGAVGVSPEEAVYAMEAALPVTSLDESAGRDGESAFQVQDTVAAESGREDDVVDGVTLRKAIQRLPARDRRILLMRYFEEKTQAEVAAAIGVSQVQISRIEKRVLSALRDMME